MYRQKGWVLLALFFMAFVPMSAADEVDSVSLVADTLTTDSAVVPSYRYVAWSPKPKKNFWTWLRRNIAGSSADSNRKFDYTVVVGPSYSNSASFTLAGGAMGQYSWDRSDSTLQRSMISVTGQVSVKGMVSANIVGTNFMKHDRFRWNYHLKWQLLPINYWGIGYGYGRQDSYERVNRNRVVFNPEAFVRVVGPLFLGASVNLNLTNVTNLHDADRIQNQGRRVFAAGIGPSLQIDTRDFAANASKGVFLRLNTLFYPKFANKMAFSSYDLTLSGYQKLWKGAVLCGEFHGWFNKGDEVPWSMMAQVADNGDRMRGYYEGRYRDRNLMELQAELRQHIWWRLGIAVFGGAGNVFDRFGNFQWRHTLPNYGLGVRYEFKNKTNVRLDVGFTKNKPGVVFSINEAF